MDNPTSEMVTNTQKEAVIAIYEADNLTYIVHKGKDRKNIIYKVEQLDFDEIEKLLNKQL